MSDARNNNAHAGNADNADRTLFLPDVPRHSPSAHSSARETSPRDDLPTISISADGVDAVRLPRGDDGRTRDNERTDTTTVFVPRGATLTSTITYSDLPSGYDRVAGQTRAAIVVEGRDPVLVPQGYVRFVENPESLAALVVSPGRDGRYRPVVGITHRKLRYLLQDSIDWYLKENGVDGTSVNATFMEPDDGVVVGDRTPVGVSYMHVLAADQDFYAPVTEVSGPSILADVATFLAVAVIVLIGYRCGVNAQNTLRVWKALYDILPAIQDLTTDIATLVNRAMLYVLTIFGKVVLRVDSLLALARELAEL